MKQALINILAVVITILILPFLCFFLGWAVGWLIKIIIGGWIISGLALVGLNIPLDSLPLFFGTLSVIASFFSPPYVLKTKEN